MPYYLTFDGGGTKVKAIVFDGDFNVVSYCKSGGVNLNFYKHEDVERHIDESIGEVIRKTGVEITSAYGVLVGCDRQILEQIQNYMPSMSVDYFGEDQFNLLSGIFKPYGVCVLCGTGASFFWNGETQRGSLGGLGAYIGDEGSGYYIGEHGIRAAMRCMNGWGEKTVLTDLFFEMTGGKGPFEYFYGASFKHIPMHMKISGFTRQVEAACKLEDKAAIDIVNEAGKTLGLQAIALMRKYDIPQAVEIVLCGGAWKTDCRIKQRFIEIFQSEYPDTPIITPILEPVAGGAVYHAYKNNLLTNEVRQIITNNFKGL
jgi:Predicted N-acetylglucosamine kinase